MTDPRLTPPQKSRLRQAGALATRLYPGPVGELVARELLAIEMFGRAFGGPTLAHQLVEKLETEWVAAAARQAFRGEVHR